MDSQDENKDSAPKPKPRKDNCFRDAKEVNKRLRHERALKRSRRPQRNAGKLKHVLKDVCRKSPGDFKRQAANFLRVANIPAAKGRPRTIGEERQTAYGQFLKNLYDWLIAAGAPCQNLDEVGHRHVVPLMRLFEQLGWSEGYIQDQLSILRVFLALVGKEHAVPSGIALKELLTKEGIVAGTIGRRTVADLPKGWVDNGVNAQEIIDAVAKESEIHACHLKLMRDFGTRCKECVQMRPAESDKGDYVLLMRGTKGKKTRIVKFSTIPEKAARQRATLDEAKALAAKNPKGELGEPGLDLKKALRRQRHIFDKHGLTKKAKGIVPHGLRHQFGTDLFQDLSGLPAPVLGLRPAQDYKDKWLIVQDAYAEVSRQMGHERVSITGAYAGTAANLNRQQKERNKALLHKVTKADAALGLAGVTDCWILGRAALGMEMLPGEKLQIAVRLADQSLSVSQVAPKLEAVRIALEEAAAEHVTLTLWTGAGVPPDALETMFAPARRGQQPAV